MVTPPSSKAKKWIEQNRDPRSAHYQAGLESVLELFLPNLEKGRILPVAGMNDRDLDLFKKLLTMVDSSPGTYFAFLPQAIADAVVPPESAEETHRIEKGKPSCKLLILRPGEEDRIISAEISDEAFKPGLDIFQSGALLGTYDYENLDDCLDGLNKAVKAHVWKKESWQTTDYHTYTLNWFERVQFLETSDVAFDKDLSFFHSPTRIKGQQVDAIFLLIYLTLKKRYEAPDFLDDSPELAEKIKQKDTSFCREVVQAHILDLLNLIKDLELMAFTDFSEKENKDFQTEYTRTEDRLRDCLMHLKIKAS